MLSSSHDSLSSRTKNRKIQRKDFKEKRTVIEPILTTFTTKLAKQDFPTKRNFLLFWVLVPVCLLQFPKTNQKNLKIRFLINLKVLDTFWPVNNFPQKLGCDFLSFITLEHCFKFYLKISVNWQIFQNLKITHGTSYACHFSFLPMSSKTGFWSVKYIHPNWWCHQSSSFVKGFRCCKFQLHTFLDPQI